MADFHKKWKDYVLLVEQAPPVGPTTRRRIPPNPVQPTPGLANLEKSPRGRISKFKGVTITFPDPDGPQTGAGKRMVTHTVTRVPSTAGEEGNWKSWPSDNEGKKEALIALKTYARNLERRLNDPEFMKVMRERHPEESRDFTTLTNMMIERPREFELRLNAIEATMGKASPDRNLPSGATAAPDRAKRAPNFANMEASRDGAIEFGKQYDISERELQDIWD